VLKSQYGLEKFETGDEAIAVLLVMAALLTLVVSRALLAVLQEIVPDAEYSEERWATDRKVVAQPVLADLALTLGHPLPNLPELVRREARQPERSRLTLNKRMTQVFNSEVWA